MSMIESDESAADGPLRPTRSNYLQVGRTAVTTGRRSAESVGKLLLTMRPYSWINVVLIGVVANVVATESLSVSSQLLVSGGLSLLLWFAGSCITEFFRKRYEYRESGARYLLVVPAVVGVQLVVGVAPLTVAALLFLLGSCVLYGAKTNSKVGRVSFLFRGLSEVGLFVLIVSIHDVRSLSPLVVEFAAIIYLLTCSRNLVGDLRDVSVDTYTLPVVSQRLSQVASISLGLGALAVLPELRIMFPAFVAVCLTGVFGIRNAYHVHRLYVLCTLFFIANYLLSLVGGPLLVSNTVFVGVLLDHTYNYTPRKIAKQSSS